MLLARPGKMSFKFLISSTEILVPEILASNKTGALVGEWENASICPLVVEDNMVRRLPKGCGGTWNISKQKEQSKSCPPA